MASIKTSQSWTITDIQCHFFIQQALTGSKIETTTLVASYDWHPRIFCPRKDCWGQEIENCEACPGDCCQRHPTAAGCNIRWAVICCPSMSSVSPCMPRLLKWTSKSFGEVKAEYCVFSPTHMTIEQASSQQEATFQNTSCSLADFFFEWAFFSPEQRRLWLTSEPDSIHTSCRSESSN